VKLKLRDRCPGSQAFPTSYNGENTRCPGCNRLLKLGVNGKVPTHNRPARSVGPLDEYREQ